MLFCCTIFRIQTLPAHTAMDSTVSNEYSMSMQADPDCNVPMIGPGRVVNQISGGLACLLCNSPNANLLLDGDLTNFVTINSTLIAAGSSLARIKDVTQQISSGRRVGFVIEAEGGLLSADLLANFLLRTYSGGTLLETATFGGGGLLDLSVLGGQGSKRRIEFTTSQSFDEVELVSTSTLAGITAIRIYYAFHELPSCNHNCTTAIIPDNGFTPSIVPGNTGHESGVCVLCSVANASGSINNDTTGTPANINFGLSLGATLGISVATGQVIPGGNEAGFVISQSSILGLLDLSVLSNYRIRTYLAGNEVDNVVLNSSLANVGLLPGNNLLSLSIPTTGNYDEIRLSITGGVALISTTSVYYAFVRWDADFDGAPDCVDKCPGESDFFDFDGDGEPDACDPSCNLLTESQYFACPPETTVSLPGASGGQSWSAMGSNPAPANINNSGAVTGMTVEGVYGFILTDGACSDTAYVTRQTGALSSDCNKPLVGIFAEITDVNPFGGICLICGQAGASNIVDGDLNNSYFQASLVGLLSQSLIIVRHTTDTFPAGTRAGYVISTSGLLDANLLSVFGIRTRLNGVVQETFANAGVLGLSVLADGEGRFRISAVTSLPFNEIELFKTAVATVATSMNIFYAFTEDSGTCNEVLLEDCTQAFSLSGGMSPYIEYQRTGIEGTLCALCGIDDIGNAIDSDLNNFSTLTTTAGALNSVSLSINSGSVNPGGSIAGFKVGFPNGLLDLSVISSIRIRTYLGGIPMDTRFTNDPLVGLTLLGSSEVVNITFTTTQPFDEVQFTLFGVVGALTTVELYGAFTARDSDNDGVPDCADKCCSGDDNFDNNGNGVPNACDNSMPVAMDDEVTIDANETIDIPILINDDFGDNGPGTITITSPPSNGTATINDNGTPGDVTDDFITYTPDNCFTGEDEFTYEICDALAVCDEATVTVDVEVDQNFSLECAGDLVLYSDLNGEGVVNRTHATILDNECQTITLTVLFELPGGSAIGPDIVNPGDPFSISLPIGVTTVTYQGDDGNGTVATCSYTVTVLAETGPDCNNPLVGPGRVIDNVNGGIACLLCNTPNGDILLDGDLTNYVEIPATAIVAGSSIVAIRDVLQSYSGGRRVGFVIEAVGGILTADVLTGFQLRTYLGNSLQQTATFGGPGLLNLNVLAGSGGKRRIQFTTSSSFDEVELFTTTALGAITALRVYYAFEEDPSCDADCQTAIIPLNGFSPAIVSANTGPEGICIGCAVLGQGNAIDNDTTTNAAVLTFGVSLLGSNSISVSTGLSVAAGSDAGFVISQTGILGILDLGILSNYRIRTYEGGILRDDLTLDAPVANVGLLTPGLLAVSIPTTSSFDEIRLTINSGIALINSTSVYYAFIRRDADGDGVPDCIDKCQGGNDNADSDGNGIPNDCDNECVVLVGDNITVCPPDQSAQLPAAGPGQTWSVLSGNPGPASVNQSGAVTGLDMEGVYAFELSDGTCADTVFITVQSAGDFAECNIPLVGPFAEITNLNPFGGVCIICGQSGSENIIDGNLNNYYEQGSLVGLLNTSFIIVRNNNIVFPAGTRAGYVLSTTGLLDAALINKFAIRTRLDGVVQEVFNNPGLLSLVALPDGDAKFRLSGNATLPFNEIELYSTSLASVATTLRVYYAFTENSANCNETAIENCIEIASAANSTEATIVYERTGINSTLCALCNINNLGNVIDGDNDNFATMTTSVGVDNSVSISVRSNTVSPAGSFAGFKLGFPQGLVDLSALASIRIQTYSGGILQQSFFTNDPLVSAVLIGSGNMANVFFPSAGSFDEVRITLFGLVSALTTVEVYYAFSVLDTDLDGTADCIDKCCLGDDSLDSNGNGVPDACDDAAAPIAVDDSATTEVNTPVDIPVLTNDDFGDNGPGTIQIVTPPDNGSATINDNGTPGDVTDDFITYNPVFCFVGQDTFTYSICDALGICDTAMVTVTVEDNQLFEITCPGDQVLQADLNCEGLLESTHPDFNGSDCLDDATLTATFTFPDNSVDGPDPVTAGAMFSQILPVGVTTVSYQADKGNGQESTCSYTVTVEDNTAPDITCPASVEVPADANCQFVVSNNSLDAIATDNCDVNLIITHNYASTSNTTLNGAIFEAGITVVVWMVTDASGNTSTCSFTVTVEDETPPVFMNCTPITLNLSDVQVCNVSALGASFESQLIANDNCSGAVAITFVSVIAITNEACVGPDPDVFTAIFEYNAVDVNGNSSVCELDVTINYDFEPDFIICEDLTVEIGPDGTVSVERTSFADAAVDLTGFTGCEILGNISYSIDDELVFTCEDAGANPVSVEAQLCTGATAVCNVVITVEVNDDLVFENCEDQIRTLSDAGTCDTDAIAEEIRLELLTSSVCSDDIDITLTNSVLIKAECTDPNPNQREVSLTYTATDEFNNSSTCELLLTLEFDALPEFDLCIDTTIYLDQNGMASITRAEFAVASVSEGSFDDCDFLNNIAYNVDGPLSFTCSDIGVNERNVTATICTGAENTCTSNITVLDTISPDILGCNNLELNLSDVETCTDTGIASVAQEQLSSSDNCDGNVDLVFVGVDAVLQEVCEPDDPDIYEAIYRFRATDDSGNTSECTFIVSLEYDVVPEFILCQNISIGIGSTGTTTVDREDIAIAIVPEAQFSGCDILNNITYEIDGSLTFDCTDEGPNVVTVTATICTGASAVCTSTITVVDAEDPEFFNCTEKTFNLSELESCDPDALGEAILETLNAGATCGEEVTITYTGLEEILHEACEQPNPSVFSAIYSYLATDEQNNTVACTLTGILNYDVLPEFTICRDTVLYLDSNGNAGVDRASIAEAEVPASLFDGCELLSELDYSVNGSLVFTCADLGANARNINAEMCTGATAVCSVNITVLDTISPEILGCEPMSFNLSEINACDANELGAAAASNLTATDNCDDSVEISFGGIIEVIEEPCEGPNEDQYTAIMRFIATDESGNTAECSFPVTLVYDALPVFTTCQDITINVGNDDVEVSISDIAIAIVTEGQLSGCGILNQIEYSSDVPLSFNCSDEGTITVNITATLCTGASAVCQADITITGGDEPSFVNCEDRTVLVSALQSCSDATLAEFIRNDLEVVGGCGSDFEISFTGVIQVLSEACEGNTPSIYSAILGYVAVNSQSDSVTCNLTAILVHDNEPEFTICKDTTLFLNANGTASITREEVANAQVNLTGLEACEFMQSIMYGLGGDMEFDCEDIGENTLNVSAIMCTGASTTCISTITVVDNVAPTIVGCEAMSFNLSGLQSCETADLVVAILGNLSATDNCDEDVDISFAGIVQVIQEVCDGVDNNIYEAVFSFSATDASGNSEECSFNVQLIYDLAPEFTVCEDITVIAGGTGPTILEIADFAVAGIPGPGNSECAELDITYEADIPLEFTCENVGTFIVNVTATTCTGMSAVCNATITVITVDEPEFLNCNTRIAELSLLQNCDPANFGELIRSELQIAEPCGEDLEIVFEGISDIINEPCTLNDLGLFTATFNYSVTDQDDQVTTCSLTGTIVYDVAPEFTICNDTTLVLSSDGTASLDLSILAVATSPASEFANCDFLGEIEYTGLEVLTLDCSHIGQNSISVTATLCTGASATCNLTVNVLDETGTPGIQCPDMDLMLSQTESCEWEIIAGFVADSLATLGGCAEGAQYIYSGMAELISAACTAPGMNVQEAVLTFEVISSTGATSVCEMNTTVTFDLPPVFMVCQDTTIMIEADGTISIHVNELASAEYPFLSDNCSEVGVLLYVPDGMLEFDSTDVGTHVITITASSCVETTATCVINLLIIENEDDPEIHCPDDVTVNCIESMNPADNPNLGVPVILNGSGAQINPASLNYADLNLNNSCDEIVQVQRTWTAVLSSGTVLTCVQMISRINSGDITINPVEPDSYTIEFECQNEIRFNVPDVNAGCAEITRISISVNGISGNFFLSQDGVIIINNTTFPGPNQDPLIFDFGQNVVTYSVETACGNSQTVSDTFNVEDTDVPYMICQEGIVVAVGSKCDIPVPAHAFDIASFDFCSDITLDVARMSPGQCGSESEEMEFGPMVRFCCTDFGTDDMHRMVILRATDASGNTNACMVRVTVQDKLPPVLTCPPDITVQNNGFATNESAMNDRFGGIATDLSERRDLDLSLYLNVGSNNGFIDGFVRDNCQTNTCDIQIISELVFSEDCEANNIGRRFTAVDLGGNEVSCMQNISWLDRIEFDGSTYRVFAQRLDSLYDEYSDHGPWEDALSDSLKVFSNQSRASLRTNVPEGQAEWDITWPADLLLTDCLSSVHPDSLANHTLFAVGSWPKLNRATNGQITMSYSDELPAKETGCHKIVRSWTVMDACQPAPGNSWMWKQIIRTEDNTAPVVTMPNSIFQTEANCNTDQTAMTQLIVHGSDNCNSNAIIWEYEIFAFSDTETNNYETESETQDNQLLISGNFPLTPFDGPGHLLRIIASDQCGNSSAQEFEFRIRDCKAPMAVCLESLEVELSLNTGTAIIDAAKLAGNSFDNCTPFTSLNFRVESTNDSDGITVPDDESLIVTCDDRGTAEYRVWIGDDFGNWSYCDVTITISGSDMACDGEGLILTGLVNTENARGIEGVKMDLEGKNLDAPIYTHTNQSGEYGFRLMPGEYFLQPFRTGDFRNGVTTSDLLLIQRHITGVQALNSPYKLIAADVNRSGSIDAFDLLELRRLILGKIDGFSNNTSWRFVPGNYVFVNPQASYREDFNNGKVTLQLEQDFTLMDYMGIKVGDVTLSANPLINFQNIEIRSGGGFVLQAENRRLEAGEEFIVELKSAEQRSIYGYQFTLDFDTKELELVEVEPIAPEMSLENFGFRWLDNGRITSSWNQTELFNLEDDEIAFTMKFKAKSQVQLSSAMEINSEFTPAIAIDQNMQEVPLSLEFTQKLPSLAAYELFQNIPNPFEEETMIGFNLPEAMNALITVYDNLGTVIHQIRGDFGKGYNTIQLNRKDLPYSSLMYYQIEAGSFKATKKMIIKD